MIANEELKHLKLFRNEFKCYVCMQSCSPSLIPHHMTNIVRNDIPDITHNQNTFDLTRVSH